MKTNIVLSILSVICLLSCQSGKTTTIDPVQTKTLPEPMVREIVFKSGPQAIVYKTTKDYSDLVPVIMDDTKTKIVSYPAPSDVYYNGKLAKPTPLKDGYLLDNRGINANVVFLKYTYEEYSKLEQAPSTEEMLSKIADKSPLTELIDCGVRSQYLNETDEINALIDAKFRGCKQVIKPIKVNLSLPE